MFSTVEKSPQHTSICVKRHVTWFTVGAMNRKSEWIPQRMTTVEKSPQHTSICVKRHVTWFTAGAMNRKSEWIPQRMTIDT